MSVDDKDEFLTKLGGKKEFRRIINRLAKEREVLRHEIESLIQASYEIDPEYLKLTDHGLWTALRRNPGSHTVLFDTECDKSPYGLHGRSDVHICTRCVWCSALVDKI